MFGLYPVGHDLRSMFPRHQNVSVYQISFEEKGSTSTLSFFGCFSMEARRLEETAEEGLKVFRRDWFSSTGFKAQMLELMEGKLGEHHSEDLRPETGES
jgi:hypothetical protein